jgi:F-type H+-transporting ATPase subunit gamma
VASVRELRKRIRSIRNLSQVTRAMEMVAASRMRRAQEQVTGSRPYAAKAWELLVQLVAQAAVVDVPAALLTDRDPVRSVVLILITGDRGLAGGYNGSMVRAAGRFLRRNGAAEQRLITVGRKGRDAMLRAGYPIEAEFGDLPDRPRESDVAPIARLATDGFLSGGNDAVFIGYTDFVNVLRQQPWVRQLLPLHPQELTGAGGSEEQRPVMARYLRATPPPLAGGYSYEPAMEELLEQVVRRFVELQIYQAVVESLASEHAARMVAMRNATENANDLLKDLTMTYNKLRQQSITEEMLDIVGGAEALAAAAR